MHFIQKNKYGLLAFLLPFAVMTGIMIATKCAPFGDHSFMIVDALHQYLPFFADYQSKLKSLDSFFYSWNGGLGYNFYSLWAYYLSSPMNLVVGLMPKLMMIAALNWLIALKFSLCSLTGFFYFTHKEKKQSLKNVAFGLCYAFSTYMTGYYWNVMWLEVMILLPVILIGMDRMMEGRGSLVYILALFGAMFCNYYMCFMVCIFLALWYFTYYFTSVKEFLLRGLQFAVSSVLAAAMAAVVLLPAYKGLMTTSSAEFELPGFTFYDDILALFSTHMVAVEPYNMSVDDGLGNLYCGILALLLLLLYVVDTKVQWKEKLSKIIILIFMGVCFQIEVLNYIWHGFHNQYGIPNRFAFIYIFLILIMAYEQLARMEKEKTKAWKIVLSMAVLGAAVGYLYKQQVYDDWWIYALSGGLLVLYGLLLMISKKVAKTVLYIFVITEVCANAVYGFYASGQVEADYYFCDTKAVTDITEHCHTDIQNRVELLKGKMLDESIWYTMNGMTMFGSTALGDTVDAMDQLGFYTGVNEYLYEGATPFTDMLFGIRGILVRSTELMYRTHYEYVFSREDVSLYEHNLPTSIGYFMNGEAKDVDTSSWNPFEVQNNIAKTAFASDALFQMKTLPEPEAVGCEVNIHEGGQCYAKKKAGDEDAQACVKYTFHIDQSEEMYLHFDAAHVDDASLEINQVEMQSGRLDSQIITVGHVNKGDTVTMTLWLKKGEEGNGSITMRAATLNEDTFETLYKTMNRQKFHLEESETTKLTGTVTANEDGLVYFGIPYDEGWKVIVDDVSYDPECFAEGFLSISVPKGTHQISLQYQPPGFRAGWKISLAGWLIFLLGIYFSRRKKYLFISGGTTNEEEIDEDCGIDALHDHAL